MTDIVTLLRAFEASAPGAADEAAVLVDDAADEIEHLRAFICLADDLAHLNLDAAVRLLSAIPGMADAVLRATDVDSREDRP